MEKHKSDIDRTYKPDLTKSYLEYFDVASKFAVCNYKETLDRISDTNFYNVDIETFYKEYCWSICTSGFNARIVSGFFDKLCDALSPLKKVLSGNEDVNSIDVAMNAMNVFGNKRKIKAMIDCAFDLNYGVLRCGSWEQYRNNDLDCPVKLEYLPFIGPITSYHLARNIGLTQYVKEDVHLVRMANHWGFDTAKGLCRAIQEIYPFLSLGIIDLVFWYSASTYGSK